MKKLGRFFAWLISFLGCFLKNLMCSGIVTIFLCGMLFALSMAGFVPSRCFVFIVWSIVGVIGLLPIYWEMRYRWENNCPLKCL